MKKVLSVLLTLAMIFSLIPMGTFTLTANALTEGYYTYTVSSGKATITDVDTSISGDVTIPSTLGGYTVTSIDDSAFYNCTKLKGITIPASVTSIGGCMFSHTALTSIVVDSNNPKYHSAGNCIIDTENKVLIAGCKNSVIPNDGSVTSIGYSAFYENTDLTSITIPNSVTSIEWFAFDGCTNLTSITFSDNLISIGRCAFGRCEGLIDITIPNKVKSIGDFAFNNCKSLARITFSNTVTSIGAGAFKGCTSLSSVLYSGSEEDKGKINISSDNECLTSATWQYGIGFDKKFYTYTITDGKATITDVDTSISGNVTIPSTLGGCPVRYIGENAFFRCTNLKSITIPDSVTSIGTWAFAWCENLTSITIPNSVTSIGSYAFKNCTALTSITIGNSVTSIGWRVFANCTGLTSITIPDSVTSIGSYAFYCCTGLTSIIVPDSINSIGYGAFYGCTGLTDVWYGGSEKDKANINIYSSNGYLLNATWHYDEAPEEKYYTYTITDDKATITAVDTSISGDVTIPSTLGGYPVIGIDRSAFEGCLSITSIAVPDGVTTISEYAFFDCQAMTSITLSDSITSIGNYAFLDTGYYLNEDNWEDNVLYIGKHLIKANSSIIDDCIVKDGTLTIADYAFAFREELTGIVISNSVKNIGECAFGGCAALESITVDSGNTVFHSEGNCLIDTENKVLVVGCKNSNIPTDNSVTSIGDYAFYGNYEITSITIPDNITSIGWCSFAECGGLAEIIISDSVKSIGEGAFEECLSLANVCFGGSEEDKENINFADGNDCLLDATWYYNVCTDGHTYSYFYDSWCNNCSWSRGDREPTTLHALEMQQNMLGITTLPYGHFDMNFDKKVDSTDLVILQMLILGL